MDRKSLSKRLCAALMALIALGLALSVCPALAKTEPGQQTPVSQEGRIINGLKPIGKGQSGQIMQTIAVPPLSQTSESAVIPPPAQEQQAVSVTMTAQDSGRIINGRKPIRKTGSATAANGTTAAAAVTPDPGRIINGKKPVR